MRVRRQDARDMHRRQDVPSGEQLPQRGEVLKPLFDHGMEQSGREPQRVHTVTPDCRADRREGRRAGLHDDQPATGQQRSPDFKGRRIEAERRQQQHHAVRPKRRKSRVVHQPQHRTLLDQNAFRLTGRARGVKRIGKVRRSRAVRGR